MKSLPEIGKTYNCFDDGKIIKRLRDLYINRVEIEKKLVILLRYCTKNDEIDKCINDLSELRGRIQELEYILSQEQVNIIKTELNIDFW